jgi:hypothetical protein
LVFRLNLLGLSCDLPPASLWTGELLVRHKKLGGVLRVAFDGSVARCLPSMGSPHCRGHRVIALLSDLIVATFC